jgi:hypothetical protein
MVASTKGIKLTLAGQFYRTGFVARNYPMLEVNCDALRTGSEATSNTAFAPSTQETGTPKRRGVAKPLTEVLIGSILV